MTINARKAWRRTCLGALTLPALISAPAAQTFSVEQATFQEVVLSTGSLPLGGRFGASVFADGDRLYVGAPWEDNVGGERSGAVYVYERAGTCYRPLEHLTITGADSQEYGSRVTADGNTLAHSDESGDIHVMVETPTGWFEQALLEASGGSVTGVPIELEDDTLAIGVNNFEPDEGGLLIYSRTAGSWVEDSYTLPTWAGFLSGYGEYIALSGDALAVSASGADRVQILRRTGTSWLEEAAITIDTPLSVDLDGDTLMVRRLDSLEFYVHSAGNWSLQTSVPLNPSFTYADIALEGDLALVGVPFSGLGGSVTWLQRTAGTWSAAGRLLPSDPVSGAIFGDAVTLEDGVAFVGAPEFSDTPGFFVVGKVYAYADTALPSAVSYCTAGTSANGCQALLSASGTASATAASGFTVSTAAVEGSTNALFFMGSNGRQANTWGSGTSFQCAVPPVRRAPVQVSTGTPGACDGNLALDLNATWCAGCPKPALNFGEGTTVQLQLWYRDPLNTSNQTTSLSDALEFCVEP